MNREQAVARAVELRYAGSVGKIADELEAAYAEGYDACREELDEAEDAESEGRPDWVGVDECTNLADFVIPKIGIFDYKTCRIFIDGQEIKSDESVLIDEEPGDWADELAAQTIQEFNKFDVGEAEKQIAADLRTAHQKGRDEYKAEQRRYLPYITWTFPLHAIHISGTISVVEPDFQRGYN